MHISQKHSSSVIPSACPIVWGHPGVSTSSTKSQNLLYFEAFVLGPCNWITIPRICACILLMVKSPSGHVIVTKIVYICISLHTGCNMPSISNLMGFDRFSNLWNNHFVRSGSFTIELHAIALKPGTGRAATRPGSWPEWCNRLKHGVIPKAEQCWLSWYHRS